MIPEFQSLIGKFATFIMLTCFAALMIDLILDLIFRDKN
jgi:hypothetical protein